MKEFFVGSITKTTPSEIPPRSKYFTLCYRVKSNEQIIMGEARAFQNKDALFAYLKKTATAMGKSVTPTTQKIAVYRVVDRKTGKIKIMSDRTWEDWVYILP